MLLKKSVLVPMPQNALLTAKLAERFNVRKLYEELDQEAALRNYGDEIEAIVTFGPVDQKLIDGLPNLKIIANNGVGVDGIDLDAARRKNIRVTNTPDVLSDAVADTAIGLLLALTRHIVTADAYVRAGHWGQGKLPLGTGITGKKCGIVGMGRIGQAIAKRCVALNMSVAWHGPNEKPDLPYRYVETATALATQSDVLILALPGGPATHHTVTAEVLERLGPQGYLINIARWTVVDETALLKALREKTIAGAGLDVFEHEPHIDPEFFTLSNTVLLPHIGSATKETRAAMADLVIGNLEAHFSGKQLLTQVA
jgi:lactate dehydrogenase-like 2-hydroxyacid dehydrogenase